MNHPIGHYVRALKRRMRSRFVRFGSLRNTEPVNLAFGAMVGTPVDRHYLHDWLGLHAHLITGRVLEVGDRAYTERFGRGVASSDILHFESGSPVATIVADLASCPQVPEGSFDCIILTQTLHYVFDMFSAVRELHRILAPGGTILCTVPGLSQISRWDMDQWGDRWRLTSLSARELFETTFEPENVTVETFGNVLSSLCFIEGIPAERIREAELAVNDPDYQILVAVAATKAPST